MVSFYSPRHVNTRIACRACSGMLTAQRTCQEAHLYCPQCRTTFPLQDYIAQMDEALEQFLEQLQCNRI